jgi:DNA-binding transcriptional LysR family regulator
VVEPLFEERVVPPASPTFIRENWFKRVEQLLELPLIQSNVSVVQWANWFKDFSDKRAPERFSVRFDRAQMSLDAATQGLGIALESTTMASLHLADGRLKPVFGLTNGPKIKAHFAVYPARHARRLPVEAFLGWLHGAAARS